MAIRHIPFVRRSIWALSSSLTAAYLYSNNNVSSQHIKCDSSNEPQKTEPIDKSSANTAQGKDQPLKPSGQNKDTFINQLQLRDQYQAPKYPVVLCHGLSGFDKLMVFPSLSYLMALSSRDPEQRKEARMAGSSGLALEYWFGIKEALENKGTTVMVAKVPGFGSIQDRARQLNRFISTEVEGLRKKSKDEIYNESGESQKSFEQKGEKLKVNLIAHSMGGLDARYLIKELEKKNYEVVSLTTVTTPHRGSEFADYVVSLADQIMSDEYKLLPPSLYQLTTDYMKKFNQKITDDPNVQYFSYGARFHPQIYNVFYFSWSVINSRAGDNDGMVSVESAKWGTYLGTLQEVDHLDLINWTNGFKRVASAVMPDLYSPKINSVALYLDIADNLAKRGL